jgi:hypothetical protein
MQVIQRRRGNTENVPFYHMSVYSTQNKGFRWMGDTLRTWDGYNDNWPTTADTCCKTRQRYRNPTC